MFGDKFHNRADDRCEEKQNNNCVTLGKGCYQEQENNASEAFKERRCGRGKQQSNVCVALMEGNFEEYGDKRWRGRHCGREEQKSNVCTDLIGGSCEECDKEQRNFQHSICEELGNGYHWSEEISTPCIIVHGGAGRYNESIIVEKIIGCKKAAVRGYEKLLKGEGSVAAVEAALWWLECDECFNCGYGSALNKIGISVMLND